MLEDFREGQFVRITRRSHPLCGEFGEVQRLRKCDLGAYVEMIAPIPEKMRARIAIFPKPNPWADWIVLQPRDVEEVDWMIREEALITNL